MKTSKDTNSELRSKLGNIKLVTHIADGFKTWDEEGNVTVKATKQTTYLRAYGTDPIDQIMELIASERQKAFHDGQHDCKIAGDPTNHTYFKEACKSECDKAKAELLNKGDWQGNGWFISVAYLYPALQTELTKLKSK